MRKKRQIVKSALYHVTSRTNDKSPVFAASQDQKLLLQVLAEARQRYTFTLYNFCIMPTHLHLLIQPGEGESLTRIIQWIKTQTAKRWNAAHGSTGHLWCERFFSRPITTRPAYEAVMSYIDQNPVKAGLTLSPGDWPACGDSHLRD
jgi:putative transposase